MFRRSFPARAAAPGPGSHPGMEMAVAAALITAEMARGPVRERDKTAQAVEAVVPERELATAVRIAAGNQPRAAPPTPRVRPAWRSENMRRYLLPA